MTIDSELIECRRDLVETREWARTESAHQSALIAELRDALLASIAGGVTRALRERIDELLERTKTK